MDRGKPGGGRGGKNKIAPPPSDIFALGTKSARNDPVELKRPGANLGKPSTSVNTGDRKKEGPPLLCPNPPKKPKLSTHPVPQRSINYAEAWEQCAEECDPADLVPKVFEANDNDEMEKVIGLICNAIKALKNQRWKPDPVIVMGLMYLIKIKPSTFSHYPVLHGLGALLKKDQNHPFKNKTNPLVSVLGANLLMRCYHEKKDWPDSFVRHYIEDALGDRVWIDNEECKNFVDNVLTAFNTRIPPKSVLQPELSVMSSRDCSSPTLDDEDAPNKITLYPGDQDKVDLPVLPRYANSQDSVEQIVLEIVKEQLNRRQPETITRNFLKLLSTACGFSEIRNVAVSRLEVWLHNPKLMRPAQELLMYVCYNCLTHTQRDVEVISQLVKMRLKTKAVINMYAQGVKELICLNDNNLSTILKHIIYNELSNSKNGHNMTVLGTIFQTQPDNAAKLLAEIFQDLLIKDDYLRPLRALFRQIVHVCRHDVSYLTFARALMTLERPEILQQLPSFEFKERMFSSLVDLLSICPFLAISPQIREVAVSTLQGKIKDVNVLVQFQSLVATLQFEVVSWLQSSTPQLFGVGSREILHALSKIMYLELADQYYKLDSVSPETEKNLYMKLVTNAPLMENTLLKLLVAGFSKESPITNQEMMDFIEQLLHRAAVNSSDIFPMLDIKSLEIFDLIFNLSAYQPPGSINIPAGYVPPNLAITNLYWKGWVILLILAAHNPATLGSTGWKRYPILRTLMEMCITNHFVYPPPSMSAEAIEEERAKELQMEVIEKQEILQYETYLAAASRMQISEQNSLLLSQLITNDPTGIPRKPPQAILDQIQNLNTSHRLGHLLCRSRKPDFLLDIIQRQQQTQSMPWLAGLVQNSEGSFNQLPVQCLCEYLLSSAIQASDKQSKQQQLLAHLQTLLTDPKQDKTHAYEVLEYFLRRLSSPQSHSRGQAIAGLKLILNSIPEDDDIMEIDGENVDNGNWLLRKLPSIPHFRSVQLLVATALRGAVQVENNPELVREYIMYLSVHTPDDDLNELTSLANEISQLVVERNSIMAAILPHDDNKTKQARRTLRAFMLIYINYLNKVRAPRDDSRFQWSDSQDLILVDWSTGEKCTMHILVVHAMIILLTYDQTDNQDLFEILLETWFPERRRPPQAFLVDTTEEALLIPDWLKLRIIRSNIPRLVDAALKDLEPYQLVLFIQSFGVPVEAMTKLLHLLDAAVEYEPQTVSAAVLDKAYMAQLVNILHLRGASGGLVFMHKLDLQVQKLPEEPPVAIGPILKPLPHSSTMVKQSVIQGNPKTDVPHLINKLFIENVPMSQKNEAFDRLHKILARDLYRSGSEFTSSSITLTIQHIYSVLSSMQVKQFLASLVHLRQFSCPLMRLILLPLKKPGNWDQITNLAFEMCVNLLRLLGDVKAPVVLLLKDFTNFKVPKAMRHKDYAIALSKESDPGVILRKADTLNLEVIGRKLLDVCFKKQKTDTLIEAMGKLLVSDSEAGTDNFRTGLLIDWLATVEPELIGTCPNLQMKLLFGANKDPSDSTSSDTTYFTHSHSCRPYLLTLLIHGASWATLHKCVSELLKSFNKDYDLTSVLDFLHALTRNPKFWQGHCETSTDKPEDVLLLDNKQLLVLVKYIVVEGVGVCNQKGRKVAIHKLEARLELFLCCSVREDSTRAVVMYLADEMMSLDNSLYSDMAHHFLLHIYMKVPKIINYLTTLQTKKLITNVQISDWSFSALDGMTHSLFIALSTPKQKFWITRSRELELCARKMAAAHPILVLRQLPLLASSLTGCCNVSFHQFKVNHHLLLYTHVMGLLELLQPHIFNEEHKQAFESTLDNYFFCFQQYIRDEEQFTNLLNRFSVLLQAYVASNENSALKYLQKHIQVLHNLKSYYCNMDSLRRLVAGIPVPREGDNPDNILMTVPSTNRSPSPATTHWSSLIQIISKIQGDDVFTALQEIDSYSAKKPASLEPIIDNIADLLVSPQGNVRSLAHQLIARALKNRPNPHLGILSAFQRCLESPRADILMSALDRLPEIVLCMQEYALPLMQKVFELGVNSNVNTVQYISKTIALLNTQKGC